MKAAQQTRSQGQQGNGHVFRPPCKAGPAPPHARPPACAPQVLYGVNQRLRVEDVDSPLVAIRPVKSVLVVAVTGDRGLCGGYNNFVIKCAAGPARAARRPLGGQLGDATAGERFLGAAHDYCGRGLGEPAGVLAASRGRARAAPRAAQEDGGAHC